MSNTLLLRIAGSLLAITPWGHVEMFNEVIKPGLDSLVASSTSAKDAGKGGKGGTLEKGAVYACKVSWNQANGYFVMSALLLFRWAQSGVLPGLDRYAFLAMMATHLGTGASYARKSLWPPVVIYFATSLCMGVVALRGF